MDTIFMNSKNGGTCDHHRLLLNLTYNVILKRSAKYATLSNLSIYCTWKNIKKSYKSNRFKISALTWNEEFELPNVSYFLSDVQHWFKYILRNMEKRLIILQ